MSLNRVAPYPVILYDPPLTDDTPEYGDEDAPAAEAGLCFAEYLLNVAVQFKSLNTDAGDYIAGMLRAKGELCVSHGITTPNGLVSLDAHERQQSRHNQSFRDAINGKLLPVRKF